MASSNSTDAIDAMTSSWSRGPADGSWPPRPSKPDEDLLRDGLCLGEGVRASLNRLRFLQAVALLGAASAYVTIVLGGTVRGMGAGLACPDWPLCHGSLIPDLSDPRIAIEYAHRLAAAATSVCLVLTFALALLWFRGATRLVALSFTTLVILGTQVAVGALTITSGLDWVVVTVHLALATATFASALIVALQSRWSPPDRVTKPSPVE